MVDGSFQFNSNGFAAQEPEKVNVGIVSVRCDDISNTVLLTAAPGGRPALPPLGGEAKPYPWEELRLGPLATLLTPEECESADEPIGPLSTSDILR